MNHDRAIALIQGSGSMPTLVIQSTTGLLPESGTIYTYTRINHLMIRLTAPRKVLQISEIQNGFQRIKYS